MTRLYLILAFYIATSIAISDKGEQCPCVLQPDGKCWSYESKYMAADIDEAVVSFPDLSMLDPPNPVDAAYPQYCHTEECRVCQRMIKQRLCRLGIAKFNISDEPLNNNISCTRYSFDDDDDDINWCSTSTANSSDSHSNEVTTTQMKHRYLLHGHRVVPREAMQSSMIGVRHLIKCAARGQEPDGEGFISLCSGCWAWREMPPEYFPRYLNERVCMDGDYRCLSGSGTCQTGIHTANVLMQVNGVLQPVNINTATYCECKAKVGSPAYGIVMG